jgi:pimeloyl-ACP methyl ester carboxylesterase
VLAPTALAATALLAGLGAARVAPAGAAIGFKGCRSSFTVGCAHLIVPLSPTGAAPGTLTLTLRRRRAVLGEPRSAVIALAGGPGQAAIPFTERFVETLGPILRRRDLVVFDQRGTGLSGALRCKALESFRPSKTPIITRCAQQIGPARGSYTSPETVADIEAIRVAGGYEKLVLYGTSYGTKVALQYAQEHPSHVEALVLDSVVPLGGPDPLRLDTFAAVPRVLRALCAFHGCRRITRNPVADLRRVVAWVEGRRPRGLRRRPPPIPSPALLATLLAGDLDPILRAEFPAAIRAASEGDTAQLRRLLEHASSGGEEEKNERPHDPALDVPLHYATACEEQQFPWRRASSPRKRLAEAAAKIRSLPARAFAPFTRRDAMPLSEMPACAFWPFTRPAPPTVSGPLPAAPTIVLSGAEDLRTPASGARSVVAAIPAAHLVIVPNTGHSVLTTEPGECGLRALRALFAHRPIRGCRPQPPPPYLKPTPLAPRRLSQVAPAPGFRGRPGRTLSALGLTLADLGRQLSLAILEAGGPTALRHRRGAPIPGLRGGSASLEGRRVVLHRYSYVRGVRVSGWIGVERARLAIGGRAAAAGRLGLAANGRLVGHVDDVHVDVALRRLVRQSAHAARSRRSPAQALAARLISQSDARALVRLATLAAQLQPAAGLASLQALAYALSPGHAIGEALR